MSENSYKLKKHGQRERGKNFCSSEKDLLLELLLPHKSVVENVKTDAVSNQLKADVWSEVTIMFNLNQTSGIRTTLQLKNLYDSLKRGARRGKNDNKIEENNDKSDNNEVQDPVQLKTEGEFNNSKQNNSTRKVYDGCSILYNKRLSQTENNLKYEEELHRIKIKKANAELEVSELERTFLIQKMRYENEKLESELRQNKLREEILLLELKHKKKMFNLE
ncbi:Myb/SANT-like DNA-binding domain [Cinara cedri]|uniref:Regulatory protein zeste n=1 Tax=Cinara cedri TaxID=506608 RepID=A0A5E4M297_9HEMI|nr:Myb/SANT-like DNA-binding domain [Cinara cedri]